MRSIAVNDIPERELERFETGIPELNWLFGSSKIGGRVIYGLPLRKLSVLAGAAGTGKSRWAITVSIDAATRASGGTRVLWFQNEVNPEEFKGWLARRQVPDNSLFVCDSTSLEEQVEEIRVLRPTLVFIDSIDMLDDYRGGNKTGVRRIVSAYREVVRTMPVHVCFLGRYTANKRISGGTSLPHEVDVACIATRLGEGRFALAVPEKNRCGRTGLETVWQHHPWGVEAISKHRFADPDWVRANHVDAKLLTRQSGPGVQYDSWLRVIGRLIFR